MMENWRTDGKIRGFRPSVYALLLVIVLCVKTPDAATPVSENIARKYLSQYGYLPPENPTNGGIIAEDKISEAIMHFQIFAGLNPTGVLDNETAETMSLPRCGVKDQTEDKLDGRTKRYALQGSRWRTKNLMYKISRYPRSLSREDTDDAIRRAFAVWSDFTDLTFTEQKTGRVNINIKFVSGNHDDGDPFDGPGGTLAHAYFPVYGGDAHFDDDETWKVKSYRGTNLFQVAAHEFGHSLGLAHSDVSAALMAPFYRGYNPSFTLHHDDINAIQALYGPKSICGDIRMDTIFTGANGEIYIFKDDHYWKLNNYAIASGYPKPIKNTWKGLPSNIDAAFTYRNGKTYFFKGSKYWKYNGFKMADSSYPKDISYGFAGIPDDLDAITVWSGNGLIYFYKGKNFWKFDPTSRPQVSSSYPKLLSIWKGIPENLDGALNYNGITYFFKDDKYYRFNDTKFAVDVATPSFPRLISEWWLGCNPTNRNTLGNVVSNNPYMSGLHSADLEDDIGESNLSDIDNTGVTQEHLVTSPNTNDDYSGNTATTFETRNQQWRLLTILISSIFTKFFLVT